MRGACRTELVNTEDQDGLVDLESEDLRLDEGQRLSVDLDEALAGLKIDCEYWGFGCVSSAALEMYLAVCDGCR